MRAELRHTTIITWNVRDFVAAASEIGIETLS
jgi:hypothetical protein